jgi:deoxyadenosine/deoxycytidine kinase
MNTFRSYTASLPAKASEPPSYPIIISLDGNIGSGKSTLLEALRQNMPEITVIQEPVADWVALKNGDGDNLLELFYRDTSRWCYTFQNCALLTRLLDTERILREWKLEEGKLPVVVTERSVFTDRYVFAEMLHREGKLDDLEWTLYLKWFNNYAANLPIRGVIHLTTSATTSKDRIAMRGRSGEERIPIEYLESLDEQHNRWMATVHLPVLEVSTEPGTTIETAVDSIRSWINGLIQTSKAT